jgi:hypothetical protein
MSTLKPAPEQVDQITGRGMSHYEDPKQPGVALCGAKGGTPVYREKGTPVDCNVCDDLALYSWLGQL